MKSILFKLQICCFLLFINCKEDTPMTNTTSGGYEIKENKIIFNNKTIQLIGANAMHAFAAGSNDMNAWKMDIAREFVGNAKQNPITGEPILDANGAYLHSLQKIVDSNRINNRITIIGAFGWDGTNTNMFTGKYPNQTFFWNDFKIKLQQWATHFKDQNDVWIEVWNEPFRYDRSDGYTDDDWNLQMTELVNIVRNTGNNNIILVPCAEQGQDESVLINKGMAFLQNKKNILFDIHAYEKWLLATNTTSRLNALQTHKLPIFFGEIAPMNAGTLMNPKVFLDDIYTRGLSVTAWLWKNDQNDTDALLTINGLPNDVNNNNWGTTYKSLAARNRNP